MSFLKPKPKLPKIEVRGGVDASDPSWGNIKNEVPFGGYAPQENRPAAEVQREGEEYIRAEIGVVSALAPKAFGAGDVGAIQLSNSESEFGNNYRMARNIVAEALRDGRIRPEDITKVLSSVPIPYGENGCDLAATTRDYTYHDWRILSFCLTGSIDNYNNLQVEDFNRFLSAGMPGGAPTADAFDKVEDGFLEYLRRNDNNAEKINEYRKDLASFRLKLYGKQEKCLRVIRELRSDAGRPGNGVTPESERSYEWQPGVGGVVQMSRGQVVRNEAPIDKTEVFANQGENVGSERLRMAGCDGYIYDEARQAYCVFDGANGEPYGREAALKAQEVIGEYFKKYRVSSGQELAVFINEANNEVCREYGERGGTTAILTKVIEQDGVKKLAYASVGDSRLYIIGRNGRARQVTHDESYYGNILTNCIGMAGSAGRNIVRQFGEVPLHDGDRFMICTDGITGDNEEQFLSDEVIGQTVRRAPNARAAAMDMMRIARKPDDRTVIVVGK